MVSIMEGLNKLTYAMDLELCLAQINYQRDAIIIV